MPGSASAAAIEALYYLNLSVDVPLLFWALSPLARRRAFSRSVWICVATAVTVTYMALKLAFRREAFLELPVVGLLLAGIIFGLFRTRDREALLFAVVYASFASIIVSTTYKMMDFAFGYNLVWASLVSVSLALAAKAVFARYCRQRVGAFMATAVRWPQALLMLLLWPTTVSILAFNRTKWALSRISSQAQAPSWSRCAFWRSWQFFGLSSLPAIRRRVSPWSAWSGLLRASGACTSRSSPTMSR